MLICSWKSTPGIMLGCVDSGSLIYCHSFMSSVLLSLSLPLSLSLSICLSLSLSLSEKSYLLDLPLQKLSGILLR